MSGGRNQQARKRNETKPHLSYSTTPQVFNAQIHYHMSCSNTMTLEGDTLDRISQEIAQNLLQGETFDSISHDIAQGLLITPTAPQRQYSFSATPPRSQLLRPSNYIAEGPDPDNNKQPRTTQTSGAWTTNRGAWSDQDEVEDRNCFVQEYNCLAEKVGVCFKQR
jgi:hypothetical protein